MENIAKRKKSNLIQSISRLGPIIRLKYDEFVNFSYTNPYQVQQVAYMEPSIRLILIVVVQGSRERRMLHDNKCNVEGVFNVKNRIRKT